MKQEIIDAIKQMDKDGLKELRDVLVDSELEKHRPQMYNSTCFLKSEEGKELINKFKELFSENNEVTIENVALKVIVSLESYYDPKVTFGPFCIKMPNSNEYIQVETTENDSYLDNSMASNPIISEKYTTTKDRLEEFKKEISRLKGTHDLDENVIWRKMQETVSKSSNVFCQKKFPFGQKIEELEDQGPQVAMGD